MSARERIGSAARSGTRGALLLMLVFGSSAFGGVRPVDFAVIQLLLLAAWTAYCVHLWCDRSATVLWPPAMWLAVLCALYFCHRTAGVQPAWLARDGTLRVLVYGATFFLAVQGLSSQQSASQWLQALILVGAGIAAYGIYQFVTGTSSVWGLPRPSIYAGRASGTYICPNHFAGFLELLLPVGLALALFSRLSLLRRLLILYACTLIGTGILFSFSRAGWIASALSIFVLLAAAVRTPRLRFAAVAVLVAALFAAGLAWRQTAKARTRFVELLRDDGPYQTVALRLSLWQSCHAMWQSAPWWGIGPGTFDVRFGEFRRPEFQRRPGHAHNDYLQILAESGVVGAGLLMGTLIVGARGASRTQRFLSGPRNGHESPSSTRSAVLLGTAASLVAVLAHSLVDFNLRIPANALLALCLLGILTGQIRYSTESFWVRPRLIGRLLVAVAGIAMAAVLLPSSYRCFLVDAALRQAQRTPDPTAPERQEALQRAFDLDPLDDRTAYEIGEGHRLESWKGLRGFELEAAAAMQWYRRALALNPYHPYSHLRLGMCLDWLGRHAEAEPHYDAALARDPFNYFLVAHEGWHLMQVGRYAEARGRFHRSLQLYSQDNPIAHAYLKITRKKLEEAGAPFRVDP